MKKFTTLTLLTTAVVLFVLAGLARKGVVALRPVKDAAGAQLFRPDGKPLMESDPWGNIAVNWQSDLFLLLSVVVLIWLVSRVVHARFGGSHVSSQSDPLRMG